MILKFEPRGIHNGIQYGDVYCWPHLLCEDVTESEFGAMSSRIEKAIEKDRARLVREAVIPQTRALSAALKILRSRKQVGEKDGCTAIGTRIVTAMARAERAVRGGDATCRNS
jgi:hypothetical protein